MKRKCKTCQRESHNLYYGDCTLCRLKVEQGREAKRASICCLCKRKKPHLIIQMNGSAACPDCLNTRCANCSKKKKLVRVIKGFGKICQACTTKPRFRKMEHDEVPAEE